MRIQKTASRVILEQLSLEQRRVFAAWRALVFLRRATFNIPEHQRRWSYLPDTVLDVVSVLRQMERREEIARVSDLVHIYQVTVPYARTGPLDEYEILMEANPYCSLSYASALSFHDLSNDLEKTITVSASPKGITGQFPSGTVVEDWEDLKLPPGAKPQKILDRPIRWVQLDPQKFLGTNEYHRFGYPLRVTNRERTLLDGLTRPELCGGLENVLKAWLLSRDVLNVDTVVDYVERLDVAVLRQRVGFVMSSLGLTHPVFNKWQSLAHRGGSSKLLASAPYSASDGGVRFSDVWNLALNAPTMVLEDHGL